MNTKIITDYIVAAKFSSKYSKSDNETWIESTTRYSQQMKSDRDACISELRSSQISEPGLYKFQRYSLEDQAKQALSDIISAARSAHLFGDDESQTSPELKIEHRSIALININCLRELIYAMKPSDGPDEAERAFPPMPDDFDEFTWAQQVDTPTPRTRDESIAYYSEVFCVDNLNRTMDAASSEHFLSIRDAWSAPGDKITEAFMARFNKFYWCLVDSSSIVDNERNYSLLLLRMSGRSIFLHDNQAHIYWRSSANNLYYLIKEAIPRYRQGHRSKGDDAIKFFRIVESTSLIIPENGTRSAPYAKLADALFCNSLASALK